jgi:hypothetical protein
MGFRIELRGLEATKRKFDRLKRNLKALDGPHQIPIRELFTPEFLRKHTKFGTFEDLVRGGGFAESDEPVSAEKFRAIPDDAWDKWIASATDFPNWREMQEAAGAEYIKRKMLEGL